MTTDRTGPAALPRHEARRRALQVLYEADLLRREILVTLARVGRDPHAEPLDAFAQGLVAGVAAHRADIDAAISEHARGWSIARMPVIDRNILRLAAYELLFEPETPPAVVIDEAVELAKALSTDDSPRYVNGVLSAILRDLPAQEGAHDREAEAVGETGAEAPGQTGETQVPPAAGAAGGGDMEAPTTGF